MREPPDERHGHRPAEAGPVALAPDPGGARPGHGLEVCLVGPFASMSAREAHERVHASGGRVVARPGRAPGWIVLGGGATALGDDGLPAEALREARAQIEAGAPLEILSEDQWLELLGLRTHGAELQRLYTTTQLARILDVPARRLRAWVRAGLIRPTRTSGRLAYFEFRQVAAVRALARLCASGVSTRRIRTSLEELARWWPGARDALGQLTAFEEGGAVLVRTEHGELAETSGQLRLEFEASAEPAPILEGDPWFERGLALEEDERLEEAVQAYARALDPARPRAEVAFNLGNALYALERLEDAAAAFTLATEVEADHVEAWNNLGNTLAALGQAAGARQAFERALGVEPDYADAHFNLAETLADQGDWEAAREHWRAYLAQDPSSSWAAEVRARLRRTDPARSAR
jgi:tetratricopeptide (TPR) repeat protein